MNPHELLKSLKSDVDVLAQADLDTELAAVPQWDSLATLLTISHFEQNYGVEISGEKIRNCRTVGDLIALVPLKP
jgi:acyl carrier protein